MKKKETKNNNDIKKYYHIKIVQLDDSICEYNTSLNNNDIDDIQNLIYTNTPLLITSNENEILMVNTKFVKNIVFTPIE